MGPEDIKTLTTRWAELNGVREELAVKDQDAVAEINMIRDKIYQLMNTMGADNMKLPEGTLYFKATAYPKLLKDPEEVIKWFDSVGRPDIAPRKVMVTRIKDYIADAMDNDKPYPPEDLVEIKPIRELHLKRNKPSKGAN